MADTDNGPILPKKPPHPNVYGAKDESAQAVDMAAQAAQLLAENQALKRKLRTCLSLIDDFMSEIMAST